MIIITTQANSRKIFAKYKTNIAAFTTGKSKGINDADIQIDFAKLHILPDEDEVNAVINGDMKAKKVIKNATKALKNPSMETKDLCIGMSQIVNIISSDRKMTKKEIKNIKKHGPNVIVIVLEDPNDDPIIKAKNKFYKKYLESVFGVFGIEPVSDVDTLKKLFGGKGKKGKSKKVVARVADFIRANDCVRINNKGLKRKKMLFGFYALELQQGAMYNLATTNGEFDPSRQTKDELIRTILNVYTNDNFKYLDGLNGKKLKKAAKSLKAKNKVAVEAYNSFVEILNTAMGTDMGMPAVKNGYDKKGKEPKMKVKKFVKFFTRKKYGNFDILELLYAHTSLALCDVAIGAKEYNKVMSTVIGYAGFDDTFSKAFISAAKTVSANATAKPAVTK